MNPKKRKHHMWFYIVAVLIFLACFLYWQNNDIVITQHNYINSKIPNPFIGYKIMQISDLHNKKFSENQSRLIEKIKLIEPDIILVTGDLVDRRTPNIDVSMDFINGAVNIAPIYYVKGNHESRLEIYPTLEDKLIRAGVTILDNAVEIIELNGETISIIGVKDPTYLIPNLPKFPRDYDVYEDGSFEKAIKSLVDSTQTEFSIMLCHRPEIIEIYSRCKADIVFTGHAHGGQIRLPFVGGIFGPRQGLFPKYTAGIHTKEDTAMVVSRGLGNSLFPFRVFNRPEIVVVTLNNV